MIMCQNDAGGARALVGDYCEVARPPLLWCVASQTDCGASEPTELAAGKTLAFTRSKQAQALLIPALIALIVFILAAGV
jgi:hypothetical protein